MLPTLLIIVLIIAAAFPLVARSPKQIYAGALIGSTLALVISLYLGAYAVAGEISGVFSVIWLIDRFSGLMILIVGVVQWCAALASVSYVGEEEREGAVNPRLIRRYFFLMFLFVASMFSCVMADNLGFMWIMLEATTLATTLLVSFYPKKGSLEAAWKYLVLCSTGLALGLFGFLILYAGASEAGVYGLIATSASGLLGVATQIPQGMLQIAFILVLIGFGTKAGLAPMHTWLPDAHSRAPSPISGLLSGVVLNVALFSILRYKAIVDVGLGSSHWSNMLFLAFGALSVVVPAAFILVQSDYKRLLAYSSIEHMGLIVFAWGLGGLGVAASLVHMVGHALSKSLLFFGAGNILLHFKSTKLANIRSMKYALPLTRGLFVFGVFALLAAPPSPLFFSEYLIVLSGVRSHPALLAAVLLAITIIFAGYLRLFMPVLFETGESRMERGREGWNLSHVAMSLQLAIIICLGLVLWTDIGRDAILRIAAAYSV